MTFRVCHIAQLKWAWPIINKSIFKNFMRTRLFQVMYCSSFSFIPVLLYMTVYRQSFFLAPVNKKAQVDIRIKLLSFLVILHHQCQELSIHELAIKCLP